MEQESDLVAEGKLIEDTAYRRRAEGFTQVSMEGMKVDYYDHRERVIHETKKSDKIESSHEAQVKYYIWRFEKEGIKGVTGIIEYPKLRHRTRVVLTDDDRKSIPAWIGNIEKIVESDRCPPRIESKICKRCAYFEFCYSGEKDS